MPTDTPDTSTPQTAPGLAPWAESIQALKDDVDESHHVLTVFALATLELLADTGGMNWASGHAMPFRYHAFEVLHHHGLVALAMTEAPDWWRVTMTPLGRDVLAQAARAREADIADREGRMR